MKRSYSEMGDEGSDQYLSDSLFLPSMINLSYNVHV